MFRNYFKIAIRNFKKQPFFTFLNTFGLAVGMAGALLITLYIYDELSYDTMFTDVDDIYRINVDISYGANKNALATVPPPMAAVVINDYPQVEAITRLRGWGSMLVHKEGSEKNIKSQRNMFADPSFFSLFGINMLEGDVNTALNEPNTLVITKSAATTYFGNKPALGKRLILDNNEVFTVTGVIANFPKNSFLRDYFMLMSMSSFEDAKSNNWGSNNYSTFVKLSPKTDIGKFETKLQDVYKNHAFPYFRKTFLSNITLESFKNNGNKFRYSLIPLKDIHLNSDRTAELSANNDIETIYIFSFIGLFLILLASVNFMNLSTVQSLKRAKEVGIRKTLGSNKRDLIKQFLIESNVMVLISSALALVIAIAALSYFNDLSGKKLEIPFSNPFFWIMSVTVVLFLGLISGSYPAFFMTRFLPAKVLKGNGQSGIDGSKVRNGLVIFQFAISVFLMISTLVVYQQLQYIENKDLGYKKDQVLIIEDVYSAGNKVQSLKEEIKKLSTVENTTITSFLPTPSNRNDQSFTLEGDAPGDHSVQIQKWDVDYDYLSTLKIELVKGRNFDSKFSTDSTAIIVNETTVSKYGLTPEKIIGKRIKDDSDSITYSIIGVVKDFHISSLRNIIDPVGLRLSRRTSNNLVVKLKSGNFPKTITQIESVWNKIVNGQTFSYYFMDDSFNNVYNSEQRIGRIFITFTILSILIACLGLFGLAAFNAEKRIKEVGVRKVLGANVGQIAYILSIDFLRLVIIAIIVAFPIGWFAMNRWLEDFSYHVQISWWVFISVAILAILISILTVSFQAIKAATANPTKSLKTE